MSATITMFGIPNCDTIKKARKWMDEHGVRYIFHDYKKAGISEFLLCAWVEELGWEALLNKSGTTFRALPEEQKQDLDTAKACALMLANPSMIRRPVLDIGGRRVVGFQPSQYSVLFPD